jgi:hypothetical protein
MDIECINILVGQNKVKHFENCLRPVTSPGTFVMCCHIHLSPQFKIQDLQDNRNVFRFYISYSVKVNKTEFTIANITKLILFRLGGVIYSAKPTHSMVTDST